MYRGGGGQQQNGQQQQQQQQGPAGSPSSSTSSFPEYAIREEKMKSARARQLYEESLRIYQEENSYPGDLVRASPAHAHDSDDAERPPPLPPKSEPPPLPPKQRNNRRVSEGSARLKHLPPVHVETQGRKSRSVTALPSNYSYEPPYHKTIIYTDDGPPLLPPKERTIIEVDAGYSSSAQSRVEKKSIETQTDDCDLLEEEIKDESIQTSGAPWLVDASPTAESNYPERRRGRARRRDSSASLRSKSVPTRDSRPQQRESDSEDEDEWDYQVATAASHEFPGSHAAGLRDLRQLDPDLRQISWSVSQLRAVFGDSMKGGAGAKVHPPPYRPPPCAPSSSRAPITSYHLGAGDAFVARKSRSSRSSNSSSNSHASNYGEESYV